MGQECLKLNPGMKCWEPPYEFCEYLDGEYKETGIRIRHNEAVTAPGNENESIRFRVLPEARVLSIYHKGSYVSIGEAYAFLMKYAEQNADPVRELQGKGQDDDKVCPAGCIHNGDHSVPHARLNL